MKFLFVKEESKIKAIQCEDYLCLEVAQSMWKSQGKEGEVVAITERGLLGLMVQSEVTSGDMHTLAREIFNLGRQYERQLQEKATLEAIDAAKEREDQHRELEDARLRALGVEGYWD